MEFKRRKHLPLRKFIGLSKNYLLGKVGLNRGWLDELKRYYGWESDEEFYKTYEKKRKSAQTLWNKKKRETEEQIRSFYGESDYWVLRQMFIHKNNCFPEIAQLIPKDKDIWFCEYGSGVGPVTTWLSNRFPNVNFTLVDLDVPALQFAKWRFRNKSNVEFLTVPPKSLPLKRKYDFITCFEVLEHVTQPLAVVKHMIEHLKLGGLLFVDFIADEAGDENLVQSQAQRGKTIDFLNGNLKAIWALDKNWKKDGGFGQYIKVKEL